MKCTAKFRSSYPEPVFLKEFHAQKTKDPKHIGEILGLYIHSLGTKKLQTLDSAIEHFQRAISFKIFILQKNSDEQSLSNFVQNYNIFCFEVESHDILSFGFGTF